MKRTHCIWICAAVLCCLSGAVSADVYVTDEFEITLRTGPTLENKIIRMLPSGQPLEILEREGGWSRVRVVDGGEGAEGWVLDRYLINRVPWKIRAETLAEKNAVYRERLPQLEQDLKASVLQEQELGARLRQCSETLEQVEERFGTLREECGGYLELKEKCQAMALELDTSEERVQRLEKENEKLRASERNRWFLSGALVLVCGLVIGMVLGRQQKKRKSLYY